MSIKSRLRERVIFVVEVVAEAIAEIVLCTAAPAERFAVFEFLHVVQSRCYAVATARIERVEVDRYAAVAAGVDLFRVEYRLYVFVDDAGFRFAGTVEEETVFEGFIVGAFLVACLLYTSPSPRDM